MDPASRKALDELFKKEVQQNPTPPAYYRGLNSLQGVMDYSQGQQYAPGGAPSPNVQDFRGRQMDWSNQLGEALNGPQNGNDPNHGYYHYPVMPQPPGGPLSQDQVESYAQTLPSYVNPGQAISDENLKEYLIQQLLSKDLKDGYGR